MKITIVVVLYKQKPEDSKTFQTLKQTLFLQTEHLKDIELILYDNSPEINEFDHSKYEGINISYHHDLRNLGIVTAYNYALDCANRNGSQWLLLLDHDTEVTCEYVNEVISIPALPKEVMAIVPKIKDGEKVISPMYSHSLRPLKEEIPLTGIQEKPVTALNSGTLIQVSFINEIGGFNTSFPLDFLDHWLFFEIYAKGYKVIVLDTTLEHELSVMDYSRVTLERYKSIIASEFNYYKNYKKDLYSQFRVQLAKRFVKQILTVNNKKIAFYTLKMLLNFKELPS